MLLKFAEFEVSDMAEMTKNTENKKFYSIAIDGPSGSGKSSLAKNLSQKLKFIYIDTGAFYRAVGLFSYRKNLIIENDENIKKYLNNNDIFIELKYIDEFQKIFLNGEDVSFEIRENIISKYASDVSKLPSVRAFLLDMQKSKAKTNNVIMDGRDIGTVILPDADLKIFLTASLEERAKRRFEELKELSEKSEKKSPDFAITYEKVYEDMKQRDIQDSSRDIAPLKAADDAILLDNSAFKDSVETLNYVINIIKEKLPDVCIW